MNQKLPRTKVGIVDGQLKVTEIFYTKKMAKLNNKQYGWNAVPPVDCNPKCRGLLPDGQNEICIGGECIIIPAP